MSDHSQEFDTALAAWRENEKSCADLHKLVSQLRFDHSIELVLFRRDIYDARPSEVLNHHLYAKTYAGVEIDIDLTLKITETIANLGLAPSRIDIGVLAMEFLQSGSTDLEAFIGDKLAGFKRAGGDKMTPKDVVLYGFGRIGRLAARLLIEKTGGGEQLRLRAIVLRPSRKLTQEEDLLKRASLLRKDSVHGKVRGTITIDAGACEMIINGHRVKVIYAKSPSDIDYTTHGINDALVIDNTGAWRDRDGLSQHLRPGASQVLFTAPGKGIKNIVYGVNHETLNLNDEQDNVFCAASCTTNAIVPVLKVMNDSFGIVDGHIESVHAYTSAQNILDNVHDKHRRGRAAAMNMVITTTGAAKAVSKVIPELDKKLTGNAVRVPIPNGSLAILSLSLENATDKDEINKALRAASISGKLVEQIMYSNSNDFVSNDVIGSIAPSVFDAPSTLMSEDGKRATLYVWYDNEYGYTCQVIRLAKYAAQVRRQHYYGS